MPRRPAAVDGADRVARRGLTLVVAAVLLAPAPAAAQDEPLFPDSRYGGGWAGQVRQLWLRAAVDGTGRFLSFAGRVEAACASGDVSVAGVPVEQAPGFALAGTTREGNVVTQWRLSGRVGLYRGTGRLDATIRVVRPGRDRRCAVNGRPWVLTKGGGYTPGPAPPRSRFHGTLDGGGTVAALLSERRRRVAVVAIGMDMRFCPRRPAAELWAVVRRVPTGEPSVARAVVREAGVVRRVRINLSAYLSTDGLNLSVSIREVARSARTGRRLWACDTQSLSGEAERFDPARQTPASSES